MVKKSSILIECKEAAHCCDKSQYNEASVKEKLKMIIHFAICKSCREYSTNNSKLTKLIKKSKLQSCSEDQKKNWQSKINQEMSKFKS